MHSIASIPQSVTKNSATRTEGTQEHRVSTEDARRQQGCRLCLLSKPLPWQCLPCTGPTAQSHHPLLTATAGTPTEACQTPARLRQKAERWACTLDPDP